MKIQRMKEQRRFFLPALPALPAVTELYLLPVLLTLLLLVVCGGSGTGPDYGQANWQTLRSDLERNLTPDATSSEMEELIRGNRDFALALYRQLGSDEGNLLLSTFSIRLAFAMVYGGAHGETEAQIAETLRFIPGQDRLHDAFNALDLALADRNLPATEDEDPVEMYIANAFWGQTGLPFLQTYLDLLARNYGAGIETLNFGIDPEACRRVINDWVAQKTRDKILDLLPEGSISNLTVAVLTNAIYLKAPWALPFEPGNTSDGAFHLPDGSEVTVPMMYQAEAFGYAEGENYKVLEMPYRGLELSMVLMLPSEGQFSAFESGLSAEGLVDILAGLEASNVAVTLPKFSFESFFRLKDTLMAMGMVAPFGGADFSGMLEGGGIFISDAYHKTFINVDEMGTEAAAATAIVMERGIMVPDYEFTADRPFLFLIRDRTTGAILFMGRVVNPAA